MPINDKIVVNGKIDKSIVVKLELSEDAARWLKTVVQNPIIEDESDFDNHMRKCFWEALRGIEPL